MTVFTIVFFLFNFSFASEAPFPKNWCDNEMCSPPQEKIWNEFNEGQSPSWSNMPKVFSGSCYHTSSYYSNEVEHFSGFIIDVEENGLSFNGSISFYAPENPYKDLDLDAARERFKVNNDLRINTFGDYGFFNANPKSEKPIRYWFREGHADNIKMAIIFGTLDHFILCDLKYHSN